MFGVRRQHSGVWRHLSSHLSSHLLLTVVLCQASFVGGFWVSKGRIEEVASYNSMYYVGENLTVYCIKFSNFTGDVYFQQGNVNYSQVYVTQINTTHALLDKTVTADDFEDTTLTCADSDGLVATAYIYTDYAPQNATDLKMVWLNEENLDINWSFNNTPYKNGHTDMLTLVTGEFRYNPSSEANWNECYNGTLNSASCKITDISSQWATVYVRVKMTNVKRDYTVTTVFPGVRIRDHVKPLPVQSVHVTALNSTTVSVDVTTVLYQSFYFITYNTSRGDEGNYNTISKTKKKSFVISGLHPAYNYTFDVRCKYEAHRGYLSEPVQFNLGKMPEDVPSTAPVVPPGGFYRSPCSDKSPNTTVFIYYQEIPDEDKNGEIVNYTATVVVDGTDVTYTQSGTPRTLKLDSVPCDGNFDVTLHANTAVGTSPRAVLHVPLWSEESDSIVDELELKLRLDNGKITAEWEPVADTHNMSLLVYYCNKSSSDNAMCQSAILHVNITDANGSYPLPAANANMKFGVAAIRQDDTTNGIKFTNCIYNPFTVAAKPSDVTAIGQLDSIWVTWVGQNQVCDSTERIIVFNYEIELSHVVASGSEYNTAYFMVDTRSPGYRLREVKQDTDYQIRIRANTSSVVTNFSDSVNAKLLSIASGLKDEEIAGITMAVLLVVLILGALVFCFCRDKFRAVKAKFSRSADIPTPTPRRVPREFPPAGQAGSSPLDGVLNQGFEPVGTSATVTHQHQHSQDSGYIGHDNSSTTPRQVALQGTDSVPRTGPTDLTHTIHTQSTSAADVTMADGYIQGDDSGDVVSSGELSVAADVTMADGDTQGDDSGGIVSSGEEPAAAVEECKPAHIPVPACFGEGESDEGPDRVGKGTLKDLPSLSDTSSNSYVRFSTEDCSRQDGEQLPGEPAQFVINFSKGKSPAPFEPVAAVVNVALLGSGTTPTCCNVGDGVDSEATKTAKLDSEKEDIGWAGPAETVTDPTKDFTQDSAREVTVSVPEQQGLGSYSQISPSEVTEKSRGNSTQEGEPSDERIEASQATLSPGYVTHDVTPLHAQYGLTSHVMERDASDGLEDEAAPGSMEDPPPSPDVSLFSSTPGGRLDEPCNLENVNPEPENPTHQDLSPATGHLPSVLSTSPAADTPPPPLPQPVEQEGEAVLDPQIDPDIDPTPQGHFDQKSEADIPPLSAMPGGYVLHHATSPDVSLPCPPPVQDDDESEGGSENTEKDATRSEESGSSLSDSTPSQSSNGGGYVPLDKVEKMTLTLDSSAAMVTAVESGGGGRERGGGRDGFERLDSGYSSPNSAQRSPQWRSSPGFTSVQEKPHNDNDDGTFNMAPAEPAMAATKKGVATQRHGERIKGENAGKERGTLGGALVMSSSPLRQASSGYVERNDVFAAAPPETSA